MIIKSLTMNNFRQFYGTQTIEFSHSNKNQIVTVILGENGRGKTGIYRAMMFALFGDAKLAQDSHEASIFLGNIKAVKEKGQSGLHCSVSLKFSHRGEEYVVTRTYFSIMEKSGVQKEQLLNASLINETTKQTVTTEKEIQYIIRQMIDERVKHYFFFDGERIERLTRVSAQQKEEVSTGIKNLLKIDQILKTKAVMTNLHAKVQSELATHSTGEYKKALKTLVDFEEEIERSRKDLSQLENKRKEKEIRLTEIDEILQAYESMKEDLIQRDQLERSIERNESNIKQEFKKMKELNKFIPLMIGENVLLQEVAKLESLLDDNAEGEISADFIQSMLNDLQCICGTSFQEESKEFKALASLHKSVQYFEEHKLLYHVKNDLKQLVSYLEGREDQLQQSMMEIQRLFTEKENFKWQLEEINKNLSNSGEMQIQKLNQEREELLKGVLQLEHNLKEHKKNQFEKEEKIKKLNFQLMELKQKSGIHQQLLEKHQVLTNSISAITEVIKKFEVDMIEELEMATTQNLQYLLDVAGQSMIKQVQVNSDYTLEILNAYNQPFLANISQGQRQVLSLSFITALAQVAGGHHQTLEMPLFMDTPFGRLSSQHQQNLIDYLPKICAQWVLLVTDKEFGDVERQQFKKNHTIGRYYELVAEETGVTKIREVNNGI